MGVIAHPLVTKEEFSENILFLNPEKWMWVGYTYEEGMIFRASVVANAKLMS